VSAPNQSLHLSTRGPRPRCTVANVFHVGDIVTYKDATGADPSRGRLLQDLGDRGGVRVWLVVWQTSDGREQRLKTPEPSLRRLGE
jgi:hypothetical protein